MELSTLCTGSAFAALAPKEVGEALTTGQKAWEAASNKLHTGSGNLVRQAEQLKALPPKNK